MTQWAAVSKNLPAGRLVCAIRANLKHPGHLRLNNLRQAEGPLGANSLCSPWVVYFVFFVVKINGASNHLRLRNIYKYKLSTFVLAHGVFRKKVKLDFTLGSLLKQLILICLPNSSHP